MVTGAKVHLLREKDNTEAEHAADTTKGYFPGGWTKSPSPMAGPTRTGTHDGTFPTRSSMAQALHHRERSCSQGSVGSASRAGQGPVSPYAPASKASESAYDPLTPTYSVAASDAIPRGYVAHALNACVQVDSQWDSMREPQEWGDGGEYDESWPAMHKRFRKALAGLLNWYAQNDPVAAPDGPSDTAEGEADDEELIVVIITHGAGCSALLSAISGQPMLAQFKVTSLSMAVKRDNPRLPSQSSPIARRPSMTDVGIANEYELPLIASDDHLIDRSSTSRPTPIAMKPSLESRRRFGSSPLIDTSNATTSGLPDGLTPGTPRNSALGSIRRTQPGSSSRSLSSPLGFQATPSKGLWSAYPFPPVVPEELSEGRTSPGADMVNNFSQHKRPANVKASESSNNNEIPSNGALLNRDQDNTAVGNGFDKFFTDWTNSNRNTAKSDKGGPRITTNGAAHYSNGASNNTPSRGNEEENDRVPALPSGLGRTLSQNSTNGLWSPKPTPSGALNPWGPPNLDDITERDHKSKRRWTVTQRDWNE
jgi:hypothetical protein